MINFLLAIGAQLFSDIAVELQKRRAEKETRESGKMYMLHFQVANLS